MIRALSPLLPWGRRGGFCIDGGPDRLRYDTAPGRWLNQVHFSLGDPAKTGKHAVPSPEVVVVAAVVVARSTALEHLQQASLRRNTQDLFPTCRCHGERLVSQWLFFFSVCWGKSVGYAVNNAANLHLFMQQMAVEHSGNVRTMGPKPPMLKPSRPAADQ